MRAVAFNKSDIEAMIEDFVTHAEDKALAIQWEKFELWSLRRPDSIIVRGKNIEARQDMLFLSLSIVTGGGPTVEACIASAWKAFHTRRRDLTSRCLSRKV